MAEYLEYAPFDAKGGLARMYALLDEMNEALVA
jgi:hypothetical protein